MKVRKSLSRSNNGNVKIKKILFGGILIVFILSFFLVTWFQKLSNPNLILAHFSKKSGFKVSAKKISFSWNGRTELIGLRITYHHRPAAVIPQMTLNLSLIPLIFQKKIQFKRLTVSSPILSFNNSTLKYLLKKLKKQKSGKRNFTSAFSNGTFKFQLPDQKKVLLTHLQGTFDSEHGKGHIHLKGIAELFPLHYLSRKFIFPLGVFLRGNLKGFFSIQGDFHSLAHHFSKMSLHFLGKTQHLSFQDIAFPDSKIYLKKSLNNHLTASLETKHFHLSQVEVIHQFIPLKGQGDLKIFFSNFPRKKSTLSFDFPKTTLYHHHLGALRGQIIYSKNKFQLSNLTFPLSNSSLIFRGYIDIKKRLIFLSSHLTGQNFSQLAFFLPSAKNQISGNLYGNLTLNGSSHHAFISFSGTAKNLSAFGVKLNTAHLKGKTFPAETSYQIYLQTQIPTFSKPFTWNGTYSFPHRSLVMETRLNKISLQKLLILTSGLKTKIQGRVSGLLSIKYFPNETDSSFNFRGKVSRLQEQNLPLENGEISLQGNTKKMTGKLLLKKPISVKGLEILGASIHGNLTHPTFSPLLAP